MHLEELSTCIHFSYLQQYCISLAFSSLPILPVLTYSDQFYPTKDLELPNIHYSSLILTSQGP